MNNVLISIVVPIYNVEAYLNKCINSLINQTMNLIEIILVDDGSPDRCPNICDEYAEKDTRIKVIHKTNGGLSDARNFGAKVAVGEYLMFVDSDDYIELDACCRLYANTINRPDIVTGAAKIFKNNRVSLLTYSGDFMSDSPISGAQFLKHELKNNTFLYSACINLYRREFLLENNLYFKYGIYHEDIHWSLRTFILANKVICTNEIFYNYILRQGSITHKKDLEKNAKDIYDTCIELLDTFKYLEDKELRSLLYDDLVKHYLSIFCVAKLYKKNFKYLLDKKFVKKYAYSMRNKNKAILFNFSPLLYCYINRLVKHVKYLKIFIAKGNIQNNQR